MTKVHKYQFEKIEEEIKDIIKEKYYNKVIIISGREHHGMSYEGILLGDSIFPTEDYEEDDEDDEGDEEDEDYWECEK